MSIFYNPKTRKSRPWVFFCVIVLPVLIVVIGLVIAYKKQTGKININEADGVDIFQDF